MPIKIKTPPIKPIDRKFRICAVVLMGLSAVFITNIFPLIKTVTETGGKTASSILFISYILYFGGCVTAFVYGINSYRKEDNFALLFQGICLLVPIIACIMNMRFAFIMILSSFGFENMASSLKGSQTYSQFIDTQYKNWIILAVGIVVSFVVGIVASVKLIKNKSHKR